VRFRFRKRSTAGNLQACRLHDGIVAPCLFNCAIDSGVFLAHLELLLATSLLAAGLSAMTMSPVAAVREAISACLASLCFLPNCCTLKLHPLSRRCGPLSAACSIASRRLNGASFCNTDEKASALPLRTERYFACTNNLVTSGYSISAITPMAEYHEPSGFQR
jgi:hypothetical protein